MLDNISYNICLNRDHYLVDGTPPAIHSECQPEVRKLDWYDLPPKEDMQVQGNSCECEFSTEEAAKELGWREYDVILGSDIVCSVDDANAVANVIDYFIELHYRSAQTDGNPTLVVLLVPAPRHR